MFDSGVELPAVGAARLAGLIEQNHVELKAAECRMLQLACAWADAHYLDSGGQEYQPLIQRACVWGGVGTPEVSEYCAAELGALQGTGMVAGRALIADALDLRYRLPRLWDRVLTGGVRAWQARRIAEQTRPLSWEACADVDHALSDVVGMMATINRIAEILAVRGDIDPIGVRRARAVGILARPAEALRLLIEHQHDDTDNRDDPTEALDPDRSASQEEPRETEPSSTCEHEPASEPELRSCEQEAAGEPEPSSTHDPASEYESDVEPDDHQSLSTMVPPEFDAAAARPRVVLHFHLSQAALGAGHPVVRPQDGGPLSLDELAEFLRRSQCQIRIQPLLDPTEVAPVDGYEVPQRLRAAVRSRQIADVFPFGTCLSENMDLDHTERYVPMDYGGPPGQTRLGNLGPMARPAHRTVTHGGWQKHQPEPGYFIHRSPTGYIYLVTNQGTLALGRTNFSTAVWKASVPKPVAIPA